ncbi:MAG: glycosyltransferase family 9 protein [Bacteroidia bacterium]|nr:glycosyltransferase family 9 protein [Bacteroidia bacterium]
MSFYIRTDCRYYRGDLPCAPHKEHGYHCKDCPSYDRVGKRILVIKLGAIGDVIRTTPLVRRFREEYPDCYITWLTLTPAILPKKGIDEIVPFNLAGITWLQEASFDIAVNLDKEKEAGALLAGISAELKFGYILKNNVIQPANPMAFHKFNTGMFDDVSKANTLSYCEEIFNICGWKYKGEEYLFDDHSDKGFKWKIGNRGKKIVGLNTGCGGRWTTRLWPNGHWINMVKKLKQAGYFPVLLGGEAEHKNNQVLAKKSGAAYYGHFSLEQFINLVAQCDLVITQVTMAMHISIALKKKVVLMNNIFNKHEFDLFGRGSIVEPPDGCECFYKGSCVRGASCMKDLRPDDVLKEVRKHLPVR